MKMWLILFAVGVSACATVTPDPWQDLDVDLSPATEPLHCVMPRPDEVVGQSIVYTTTHALEAYRVCSEANEVIASEHAAQIDQLKISRKGLTEAGQAQRQISEMRNEMLADERKHNFFEKIGLYVLVIGLAL